MRIPPEGEASEETKAGFGGKRRECEVGGELENCPRDMSGA